MNPEPESPYSRVERTLVSVWCYITEAVSRFLRPQPAETANNDPNSIQESNVEDEAPGGRQKGADTSGEETCEDQPFQTVSLLSSSSPAVPWEQCIADVDVKPKQDQENKEDMREEEFGHTGNDHTESEGENACQERQEKSEKKNSDTYEENETTENNDEHATVGSGHMLLKDVVSDGMDSRVEEVEHVYAERLDECLKVVETMKEPQEDDGHEKKEGLEEESKIKDCSSAEKEESNAETGEQRYMLGDVNICQDSQQLSLEFSEFSGFAKDEKKDPGKSKTDDEPEQKKSSRAVEDVQQEEHVVSLKPAGREDDPSTGEDQFGQRAHDSTEQMITEDITEQVGPEITQLHICVEESVDKTEDQANAGSKNTVNEEICEEIKKINKVAAAGEDSVGPLTLYGSQDVEQAKEDMEDENSNVEVDKEEDNENSRKVEEEKLCSVSKEKESNEETGEQMESKALTVIPGDAKICEDALELSSKQEKSQTETQHPLCQEFSDLAEDESVLVADIIEEEPNESAKHEEPNKKSSLAVIDVQKMETAETQSITACEDDRGKAEEEFGLKENISTEQLITKEMTGHQIGQEISGIQQLNMFIEREGVKNIEDQTKAGSAHTENVLICEGMVIKDEEAAAGGDTVSTLRLDVFPQVDEDTVLVDESSKINEDQAEENEEDFKEESGVKLWTIVEEKESNEETEEKREDEGAAVMLGDANIYEETLQLSPELENKSEDGTHSEALHIVSKELSSSTKDEGVWIADTEEEDSSKSETDEEPEEKGSRAAEDVQHNKTVFTPNVTGSKYYPGTGEKQFGLTGQNSAEQLITEDMMGHHLETEKTDTKQFQTLVEKEDIKNTEDQIQVGSNDTVNEPICEEIEKGDERAAPGEDPKSTVSLDGSQIVDEALEILKYEANSIQEDKLEKNEEDIEMEHEVKLCTISIEEDSNEEGGEQKEGEVSAARLEDAQICGDALQLSPRQDNSEERRQAETQLVCKELSGLAEDERVSVADTEEDPSKSKIDEESKQKGSRAAEDVQDENVLTSNITSSEDDYGTGEEQFDLKGDDAEQHFSEDLDLEDMTGHHDEQEINVIQHLQTCEGHDVFESKEDQACVGSDTGKKKICEEVEKRDEKASPREDPKSTVSLDGSQIVDEALEILKDEANNIQEDKLENNEEDIEMEHEVKLCTISIEEDSNEEGGEQKEGEVSAARLEDAQICGDALQLSPRQDNSEERRQAETQLVCKELSGSSEEERVSVADTEEDPSKSKMDEEHTQIGSRASEDVHDENVLTPNLTSSEDDYGTGEEQFDLKGDDAEQHFSEDLDLEDMTGHHDEQEINVIQHLQTCEGHDVFESKEDQACVGSDTDKKAICEEVEKRDEKDAAGEDPKSTVSLDGSPKDDEAKDSREERSNIQEDEEKENEQNFEKQSGIKLCTVSKEEEKNEETGEQREIEAGLVMLEDGIISEDTLQFSPEKQHASDEKTEELDELIDENVQMTIEDVGQEENVSIPETTTFKEEHLLETIIQNAREKNVTMEYISTDENTEIAAGERLSIEVNEEGCMERVCITTPVTVTAEGESAREINTGFNNIPLGVIEGQAAQSAELDAEAHEETPEAVPEYNNDLESDANSTQTFLEEGNSEEIQNTDLPEEVGVFKSSSTGGAEYLPIGQGSAEDSRKELEFIEKEQTGTPRFVEDPEKPKSDNINLELEQFSEEEKVKIVDTSMKTEFKQSDQEFEEYSGDETGQQDETSEFEIARLSKEASIDGFGKREVLTVDKGAAFADESTKSLEGQEKRTGISLGPNVQSFSLQDDHGNLKNSEEIKSKLFDKRAIKPLQLEFDAEEQGCTDEGELEMTPLQLGGMSADQMIGKWETSQHLEKNNQSPHRLAEMTQADVTTDIESTDEPKLTTSEGLPLISAVEEKHEGYSENSAGEHQGVIDEEILDLWIETVMSDDTDRSKEEDLSGPGPQKDQVDEESGETSFEDEREEEMKANSEEPASPSETEISLSTFEPGLVDQHFSEKKASTGLLEDINNIPNAGSSSEDVAEFSMPIFDSALVQETTEVTAFSEIRSYQDSGVSSPGECHPIQECATVQEKTDETKQKTGVEIRAMCRDTESVPKTKAEDDPLEATVAEISEEIQPLESWQHRKNSQVESERQQFTPVAPEHRSPGDIIKSFSDSSRTELEENLSKVEGPILDFALQRSRIAVKNPRVRPPTDPRSLINMPSVDPTPSTPVSGKALPGVPLGGLGVGIKLPGLGAGFPVLRKTPRALKNEDNPETKSQESTETTEKKEEEEKSDAAKKDEAPKRPKWMPPGQPGFGNPLMSELKTKLKKTSKE